MCSIRENHSQSHCVPDKKDEPLIKKQEKEIGGRSGPDPTRYGDWECKGIARDF